MSVTDSDGFYRAPGGVQYFGDRAMRATSWVHNPIDAFVLARLEKEKVSPSPRAGETTLLRRVSLDLTGLPPAPRETDEFLADGSLASYERRGSGSIRRAMLIATVTRKTGPM
jgi:hypothetical protein